MVEKRNCSFCGEPIEPGTGKMYVKKDGSVFNFCSNKCKKNNVGLGRVPRRTRWTNRYGELKASALNRQKGPEEPKPEPEAKQKNKAPAKKAPAKKAAPKKKEKSK
ncbi:MAG: 50S ribosomal protein L24e [Candidatus Thermoplasmatota archaeon]|nr:50S ribosomal protein L24e [Euryarchaeota archaeon]MBU4032543.1 50S ribosomal protein L24e [Candidatus Thermoplasmatota archaeon]MBU4072016.1 50S ribosomal protein L24e [Candidatus Thermoplasmatota archaeon]MBU4144547.1 50S ribosomal protein L24e [Candidatus Thermoplasmatota archaeon]MBU4592096.1 50S ribosomal protein L24e [Candidatus Thermoplasmatota archaeon]